MNAATPVMGGVLVALMLAGSIPDTAIAQQAPKPHYTSTMSATPKVSPSQPPARAVIGSTERAPLATLATTRPDIAQNLRTLQSRATDTGSIRLIVGVRAPFAPEGSLAAAQVTRQRDDIRAAQSAVMQSMPTLAAKADKVHHFDFIPFMALEANSGELESLAAHPDVTSIEEDRLAEPALAESSPLIGASAARSSYSGNGQVVAVLDTGVDKTHAFLSGKVVSEACYSTTYSAHGATSVCPGGVAESTASGSGVNCSTHCEHGTHVAGIVAGSNGSFAGVAPNASIIAIQVFSRFDSTASCGSTTPCVLTYSSDQIKALQRVYNLRTTYSIAAVNMSLGGGRYTSQADCDSANSAIKAAIDNLRAANIATVISSGNNGYSDAMSAPGCISSAISVGSTWDAAMSSTLTFPGAQCSDNGGVDKVACYSNSISFLNLLAPGSQINSSIPGGSYANFHGTSMASPQVAGAFALLKQKAPGLTVAQGLNALASTGQSVTDSRNGLAKPRIRVVEALASLAGANPTFALTVNRAGTGSGTVTATGINCGADCTETYSSGTSVTLNAAAESGSTFTGWSGDCAGTSYNCTLTMTAAKSVIANFARSAPTQPDLVVTAASAPASGFSEGQISISFTVKNQGTVASTASWLGILASRDNAIAGIDIDTGWGCDMDALTPGQTQDCTGPITLPKLEAGSYYFGAYADYGNAIAESNESNNGLAAASPTTILVDLFPYGGQFPAGWTQAAGSNAPWVATSATAYLGGYSLRSGTIGNSQSSGISYTANFPAGTVSFARKISSEANYDLLRFYIDGIQQGVWSGEQDWAVVSYPVSAGSHELKWAYSKDVSLSSGSDAAWIDAVTFPPGMTPGAPSITRLIPGNTSMKIAFAPPASAGGSAITGYTAACSGNGATLTATGSTTPILISGLTRGVSYTCSVTASNGAGTGAASATMAKVARPAGNVGSWIGVILGD